MEISTVLGLIIGLAMMVGVLLVGESHISLAKFIDPPAMMMVFGGAIAVTLVGFPLKQVLNIFRIVKKPFFGKPEHPGELIDQTRQPRPDRPQGRSAGPGGQDEGHREPLHHAGDSALGRRHPERSGRGDRATEIEAVAGRHRDAKKVLDLMGRCGPAFGMIATLLGLILMLGNLDNPDTIGPSMAVALIGTLYGAVMANLFCIPLGEKLSYLSHEELLLKQIIIKGILSIQAGDNPRIVRQKLDTFLPPKLRQQALEEAA